MCLITISFYYYIAVLNVKHTDKDVASAVVDGLLKRIEHSFKRKTLCRSLFYVMEYGNMCLFTAFKDVFTLRRLEKSKPVLSEDKIHITSLLTTDLQIDYKAVPNNSTELQGNFFFYFKLLKLPPKTIFHMLCKNVMLKCKFIL